MTHQMTLVRDHEGTQEWHCETCGRVLLIEWNPWRLVVVAEGDASASHAGSVGGLVAKNVDIDQKGE